MNPRTFLKQFAQDIDRDRMVTAVYGEMVDYCRENDITEDDISTPELEALAEGFVERGFSFEREETFDRGMYEGMDELGSASDGSEIDER
jgi:hypothetical protein